MSRRCPPPRYAWADPRYELVAVERRRLQRQPARRALRRRHPAETTGEDNLKTLRLVFASYDSARTGAGRDACA